MMLLMLSVKFRSEGSAELDRVGARRSLNCTNSFLSSCFNTSGLMGGSAGFFVGSGLIGFAGSGLIVSGLTGTDGVVVVVVVVVVDEIGGMVGAGLAVVVVGRVVSGVAWSGLNNGVKCENGVAGNW
jgi:hypothetical protein